MANRHMRIEVPALLPGGSVECDHMIMHRAQVERVADLQGCDLEGGLVRVVGPLHVAGMERPYRFQSADRRRCDVRQ